MMERTFLDWFDLHWLTGFVGATVLLVSLLPQGKPWNYEILNYGIGMVSTIFAFWASHFMRSKAESQAVSK